MVQAGKWVLAQGFTADAYGAGELAQRFEKKIADLLGLDDAVWFPTGTMAQLSALRIFGDRSQSRRIGWHPSSHHLLHEQDAYRHLHQLESKILCPWERVIEADDISKAASELAAISIELPVRWIAQQQTWPQLQALKASAAKLGTPLMMDGARLWETQPYYEKSYAEICSGFSAVYVSFYKMIGAANGAMLAGDVELCEAARLWRHRHGGNLYQHMPNIADAAMRIDDMLPRLDGYYRRAVDLANLLDKDDRLIVMPNRPQTNLFRVFLPEQPETLALRRDAIAARTGIWVGDFFRSSRVPGLSQVELQIGPGFDGVSEAKAAATFLSLLDDDIQ